LVAWRSPERYFLALSTLALAGLLLSWRAPFPARAGEGFRLPSPRGKEAVGEVPAPLSSQEQG
ncbi:MAG TPA: hypothetical protein VIG77_14500, partial [Ktedonobacterales bacterium]